MYDFDMYDFEDQFWNIINGRFAFLFLLILFISVGLIVVTVIANWKLFKKAGKNGWEALIPFYNSWVSVEIAGLNWWWFLLILATNIVSVVSDDLTGIASLVSLFASFNCFYNIAKKFKKDTATSVCAGIFSFIFIFIFAFSKNEKYYDDVIVSKNGVFKDNDSNVSTNNTVNSNGNYCVNCGNKLDDNYKFCPKCGKEK